jgi:hypothetical protein
VAVVVVVLLGAVAGGISREASPVAASMTPPETKREVIAVGYVD